MDLMTHGLEVPNATGLLSGAPGSQVRQRIGRQVLGPGEFRSVRPDQDASVLGGEWEELGPKPGLMAMRAADVIALRWQGEAASAIRSTAIRTPCGTTLRADWSPVTLRDPSTVSRSTTMDQTSRPPPRSARASARNGSDDPPSNRSSFHPTPRSCPSARASTRDPAVGLDARRQPPLHPDLQLTAFSCPHAAALLAVDVHLAGTDPVDDALLDLASVEHLSGHGALSV